MLDAPIPTCPSRRLVGLELEYDAGRTAFRSPALPVGWEEKHDGSLQNGREYVLDPALPLCESADSIKAFCLACNEARMNTVSRGGFHVHVQSHDYGGTDEGLDRAYRLMELYRHFQPVIDRLVAKSRVDNHYCAKFHPSTTRDRLISDFRLTSLVPSRIEAKSARSTLVVNFAMCRTRSPAQRSVEFRQGSPSKQFECVWGWTVFVTALTEIAAAGTYRLPDPTLEGLKQLLTEYEQQSGSTNIAAWVSWRDDYMNRAPTEAEIMKVVQAGTEQPHGLFHFSRKAELNLPLTQRAIDAAVARQLLFEDRVVGRKWLAPYAIQAPRDLEVLMAGLSAS